MRSLVMVLIGGLSVCLFSRQSSAQDLGSLAGEKPVSLSGSLGIGLGTYHANGIPARQRALSYLFNGAPTLSIYGVSFPFTVVMSDQQRSYTQPFNQYGISPTYKWITFHAGWRSLEFSPFTLAGHNFLGGGIELNPGKFRLGFIYGRFNKAIAEDPTQPQLLAQQPSYRRTGYSARIGYGTDRNHADLIILKAKDDSTSLATAPTSLLLTPAKNLVLGISTKFSFLQHFFMDMDVSGSIYTRDLGSDTIENLHIKEIDFMKRFLTLNTTSQLLTAGQASLGYQASNYTIKAKYRRVDPDYKSMGAYYFETDVQNYTLEGMLRLLKGQMQLAGSFGVQNDNIQHDKAVRSNRRIGSASISFNKSTYGMDLRYTNFGVTQDRGLNPVLDALRVARTNHNLNSMFRYNINHESVTHGIIFVANIQSLVDLNENTKPNSTSNSKTANLSYQFGLPKKMFGLQANLNYTIAKVALGQTDFYGPTLGINQALQKGKIGLNASASYQLQRTNHVGTGTLFSGNFNGSYRIFQRLGANVSVSYLKSHSTDASLPSFDELRTNLGLIHSF